MRVLLLELEQLAEVAVERLTPGVADPVDGKLGGDGPLIVGPRVSGAGGVGLETPALLVDVGERIVEVCQLGGRSAGVEVLHVELASVDAPLREVADRSRLVAIVMPLRRSGRPERRHRRQRGEKHCQSAHRFSSSLTTND
jgi:hypothetical protein